MYDSDSQNTINSWIIAVCVVTVLALAFFFINKNSSEVPRTTEKSSYTNSTSNTSPIPPSSDRGANGCYTSETVRKHYGENDCIVYSVGYTYETSAGTKFLDEKVSYTTGFVGYIPRGSAASGIDINALRGKNIKVTGNIQEYNGYPEIIINDASQVKVFN